MLDQQSINMKLLISTGIIVLLLLSQFGGMITRLDLFSHFLPLSVFVGVLVYLFRCNASRYVPGSEALSLILLGLLLFVSAGRVIVAIVPSAKGVDTQGNITKIVSFNIHKDNQEYPQIAAWLKSEEADFVIALEADQPFIEAMASQFPFSIDCLDGEKLCSTIILSKVPSESVHFHTSGDPENRGSLSAVTAVFCIGRIPVSLVATHLSRPMPVSIFQRDLNQLVAVVTGRGIYTMIVAGDFNLTPWSFNMKAFEDMSELNRARYLGATWPANYPGPALLPIDHFLTSADLQLVSIHTGPPLGSDHKPLIARFNLPIASTVVNAC